MITCFHCDASLDGAISPEAEGRVCASCGVRANASDFARESRFKRSTPLLALATLAGVAGPLAGGVAMAPGATRGLSMHSLAMLALVGGSFAGVFVIPGWIAWRSLSRVRPSARVRWVLALFFGLSLAGMGVFAVGTAWLARRLPAASTPATTLPTTPTPATPP